MKKTIVVFLLVLSFNTIVFAQEKISEVIQDSQIAYKNENALYFIDFWATWCGPCKHASKYLTYLQKVNPKSFYVVSMTKENPDIVKQYLKKNPTELAVLTDFNGQTYKKYNVKTLPYGVLLNASGKVLWKGDAADIKDSDIKFFLGKNKKTIKNNNFFRVTEDVKAKVKVVKYTPKEDFEIAEVSKAKIEEGVAVTEDNDFYRITGSLSQIFTYLLKTEDNQVLMDKSLNTYYEIYAREYFSDYEILQLILEKLNIEKINSEKQGEVLFLNLETGSDKFWDTQQIVWEEGTPAFLIDDYQIKGNDVNFNQIKYQLSHILQKPIIVTGAPYDLDKHDWEVHYKFPNLMIENLKENYGISAEEKNAIYMIYTFKRK